MGVRGAWQLPTRRSLLDQVHRTHRFGAVSTLARENVLALGRHRSGAARLCPSAAARGRPKRVSTLRGTRSCRVPRAARCGRSSGTNLKEVNRELWSLLGLDKAQHETVGKVT